MLQDDKEYIKNIVDAFVDISTDIELIKKSAMSSLDNENTLDLPPENEKIIDRSNLSYNSIYDSKHTHEILKRNIEDNTSDKLTSKDMKNNNCNQSQDDNLIQNSQQSRDRSQRKKQYAGSPTLNYSCYSHKHKEKPAMTW
jgi:hypothetical protein